MAVGLVVLAAGLLALNRALVGVYYDDGLYAGLALALGAGDGYVHPHLPGMPVAVHYPPLYPVVLTPLFGLLPLETAALAAKALNAVLAALGAGLIAWHATRCEMLGATTPPWVAPTLVAAASLAVPVLATQSVLFAEPLFGVLLALAVIVADRRGSAWLAGSLAAGALLTRSIGIAAGAGIVCFTLLRDGPRRRLFGEAAPVAVAAGVWGAWVLVHRDGIHPALALNYGTYAEHVMQAGLAGLRASVPDLPRPLVAITLGWVPLAPVRHAFAAAAVAVGLYGLWVLQRRSAIAATLVSYLAILAVWPSPPDRFLWAVLPWLALVWGVGAAALWRWVRALQVPLAILAAASIAGYLAYDLRGLAHRSWEAPAQAISANFAELLPVLDTLPEDAVLATDDEALVWLYTRRRTVPLFLYSYRGRETVQPSPMAHRAFLEQMGATHIVLASAHTEAAAALRALVRAFPGWLTPVHRWSGARWLFAVRRER